jgi:hypothetical protein
MVDSMSGAQTGPGATLLARMPRGVRSWASEAVTRPDVSRRRSPARHARCGLDVLPDTARTADVVLMRSDPLNVATAITISRGTRRKERQNLGWATGYNSLAIPIAAGALEPAAFTLSPQIAALGMSGSSIIVALNAILLRRLHLPGQPHQPPASHNPAPQT